MTTGLPVAAGIAGLVAALWGGWPATAGVAWGVLGGILALRLHLATLRRFPADPGRARRRAAAGAFGRFGLRLAFLAAAITFSPACFAGTAVGLVLPPALVAYHATRS